MTRRRSVSDPNLAERLQTALLPSTDPTGQPTPSAADRILDAATRRFTDVGVDSTTMSSIAAEAGLSREWLYRHFPNRDAVLATVVQRELRRFIDGLAVRASDHTDVVDALTDAFVYSVEFLRDQGILAGIVDRGGYDTDTATIIAETLTRLVGSTVVAPKAHLDLHDANTLRAYATRVVPAVVRGS